MSVPSRGRHFFTLASDLATGRLIEAMRAVQFARMTEPAEAKALVDAARAVRGFVQAREMDAALTVLRDMPALTEQTDASQLVARQCTDVRRALGAPEHAITAVPQRRSA